MVIVLPPERIEDAITLLECSRNHGPHTEDLFKREDFKRIALALRKLEPTLSDWSVLAIAFRDAGRHLMSNT